MLTVAYGRDAEVEKVLGVLKGSRPSLVLIGPSGSGKSAILHEVIRRMRGGQCPEALAGREVWSVSTGTLLADQKYIGQLEGRMQRVVAEVRERNAILYVEDAGAMVEAGRHEDNSTSMADYFRRYLQAGSVVIIGEATPERWRYAERLNPGFTRQFSTLRIEPTDDAGTLRIATNILPRIEQREGVRFVPGTCEAALGLTNRFLPYRSQPGKTVRLVEQAAADCRLDAGSRRRTRRRRCPTWGTRS